MTQRKTYWVPLESNPAVISKFAHSLGVPKEWGFSDCFGLDDDLLSFVHQPCLALILLFPDSKLKALKSNDEITTNANQNVYFMKQLVGNACGTVAVVHSLANNTHKIHLQEGFFKNFLERTKISDPLTRGQLFGEEKEMEKIHASISHEGQTNAPEASAKVDYHFVSFVNVGDSLYQLDGGKAGPINHGPTTENTFLKDAVKVIQNEFMAKLPDELNFVILTLGPSVE